MISLLTAESYQGRGANATGIYSTTVLISTSNTAEAGDKTITLRMTDEAGNETTDSTAVSIRLEGTHRSRSRSTRV